MLSRQKRSRGTQVVYKSNTLTLYLHSRCCTTLLCTSGILVILDGYNIYYLVHYSSARYNNNIITLVKWIIEYSTTNVSNNNRKEHIIIKRKALITSSELLRECHIYGACKVTATIPNNASAVVYPFS